MLAHKGTIKLETERLVLRRLTTNDAVAMFETYANDERVTKFLSWTPHLKVENTKALLQMWMPEYERLDYYHWAIVFEEQLIGSISCVSVDERNENCEIGYCIAFDHWRKGFVTEALNEIIKFLFLEVSFHRIIAKHDSENPNSGKVMQKCGMCYEGTMKEQYKRHDGTFGDSKIYAIIKSDWSEENVKQSR